MKKRYLYYLLFGIPGFGVALIIAFMVFGAASGVLWLYAFGDEPWPPATGVVLPLLFLLFFLILWGGFTAWGFVVGRGLESRAGLERKHLLWSLLATLALLLLIYFQLGDAGRDRALPSLRCSDYCRQQGYAASGVSPANEPDRVCSCYDASGKEAVTIPLANLLGQDGQ